MQSDKEARIRERAYAIWEAEGRPHGMHDDHWRRATHEVEHEEGARTAAKRGSRPGSGPSEAGGAAPLRSRPARTANVAAVPNEAGVDAARGRRTAAAQTDSAKAADAEPRGRKPPASAAEPSGAARRTRRGSAAASS